MQNLLSDFELRGDINLEQPRQ